MQWANYQYGLLYKGVTVLPHAFKDLVGGVLSGRHVGLGCDCQRVDEGLWVFFAHVYQQLVDQAAHQGTRRVNTGNQLGDHLTCNKIKFCLRNFTL